MEKLINFWDKLEFREKPYIHPDDHNLMLDLTYSYNRLSDLYEDEYWKNKKLFHTDLLPVPYIGDLKEAKIFLLYLNPGFTLMDYYPEENSKDFTDALKANIQQNFNNLEYPFFYLNPELMWTNASQYWLKKFKDYISLVNERLGFSSHIEATKYLSKRIAVLQLMPYHSVNFDGHGKLLKSNKLLSVEKMQQFFKDYVLPKVRESKASVICTRQPDNWGLKNVEDRNIIIYKGSKARSASISRNSDASPIFEKFLFD